MTRFRRLALVVALLCTACYGRVPFDRDGAPGGGDPDGGGGGGEADGSPGVDPVDPPPPSATRVDLLFVVDNSNSMAEEQRILTEQIEFMVRRLVDPVGDPETGALPRAADDIHVGVISTDMGTGGYTIMTCANPMLGDDGALQNIGRHRGCSDSYSASDCPMAECPWLSHTEARPDDGTLPGDPPLWDDFGCIATLGTGGCGFEQQLEASLVALTTQAEAGRINEGFLRPDSVLGVIYLTDEDDCSTPNAEMFNPSRDDLGPLNVRCALREDQLHPLSRYVDGLRGLRPGREDDVVVAAIVGVPVDGSWSPGDPIARLRELRQVNPSNPNQLLPSCDTHMGYAFPPVRIAELTYMFGDNGVLGSICRSDFTSVMSPAVEAIQGRLAPR